MKTKILTFMLFLIVFGSCKKHKTIDIDSDQLLKNIETLSNDSYEGRAFSRPGSKKAQKFIIDKFKQLNLQKVANNN